MENNISQRLDSEEFRGLVKSAMDLEDAVHEAYDRFREASRRADSMGAVDVLDADREAGEQKLAYSAAVDSMIDYIKTHKLQFEVEQFYKRANHQIRITSKDFPDDDGGVDLMYWAFQLLKVMATKNLERLKSSQMLFHTLDKQSEFTGTSSDGGAITTYLRRYDKTMVNLYRKVASSYRKAVSLFGVKLQCRQGSLAIYDVNGYWLDRTHWRAAYDIIERMIDLNVAQINIKSD